MKSSQAAASGLILCALALSASVGSTGAAQSRISFNNQYLFLSGSNVAWVNFAGDLGPGSLDTARFASMYDSIQAHGGNALRLWLHTNGTQTPAFDANGRVIGPGAKSVEYLQKILDMAWQRKIGLLLCLWSFDMQRKSIGTFFTDRNALMLNDTSYTHSYITNALIPLATAVKGHPAIISWEVFNEAEGMSDEYGWTDIYHVPMVSIQRFVNLVAGALHRVDSAAKVTTGAWDLTVQTDVNPLPKVADGHSAVAQLSAAEIRRIEKDFEARYGIRESAEAILSRFAAVNYNFYRDDRLIDVGGDSLGTLDFYTSHYYNHGQGTWLCPFLNPSAAYGLTKPLVIAEFWPEDVLSLGYTGLYRLLYDNGYAGALSWGWYAGGTGHDQTTLQRNTMELVGDLFSLYPEQIEINPVSGTIYAYTATPQVIDRGETSIIEWKTALGTTATLDGTPVSIRGSMAVTPDTTSIYTLVADGTAPHAATVTVHVYPSGEIISFSASATTIGSADHVLLRWKVAHGSVVTLDDSLVNRVDSLLVHPGLTKTYTLRGDGTKPDTASITITVVPAELFNRALGTPVTVSASSTDPLVSNPQYAVDGDTATQWVSGTGTSTFQTITCDLSQNIRINRVVVRWGERFPTTYRLSLRREEGFWFDARTVTTGAGGTEILDSVSQTGRFVQLWLGRAGAIGFAVREFEVYGTQEAPVTVDGNTDLPGRFALLQNFPNPFNPFTVIEYHIPTGSVVRLAVYDLLGREVGILAEGFREPGRHRATWDARGKASGVFFCVFQAYAAGATSPVYSETRRLHFVK
jgi:hypothetical protein